MRCKMAFHSDFHESRYMIPQNVPQFKSFTVASTTAASTELFTSAQEGLEYLGGGGGGGGGARFRILGGIQWGPNSQQAHDVVPKSSHRYHFDIMCPLGF